MFGYKKIHLGRSTFVHVIPKTKKNIYNLIISNIKMRRDNTSRPPYGVAIFTGGLTRSFLFPYLGFKFPLKKSSKLCCVVSYDLKHNIIIRKYHFLPNSSMALTKWRTNWFTIISPFSPVARSMQSSKKIWLQNKCLTERSPDKKDSQWLSINYLSHS